MHSDLYRFNYSPGITQGRWIVGDLEIFTTERPWVPGENKGGKPFKSCVPDGTYNLIPFERSNGDQVLALLNPALGVHLYKGDGLGRYAILIHAGNWVTDVVGCIAPGRSLAIGRNPETEQQENMVSHSKWAMKKLAELMPFYDQHTLTIHNAAGAVDGIAA